MPCVCLWRLLPPGILLAAILPEAVSRLVRISAPSLRQQHRLERKFRKVQSFHSILLHALEQDIESIKFFNQYFEQSCCALSISKVLPSGLNHGLLKRMSILKKDLAVVLKYLYQEVTICIYSVNIVVWQPERHLVTRVLGWNLISCSLYTLRFTQR